MTISQIYDQILESSSTSKPAIRAQLNRLCETRKIQRIEQGVYAANSVEKLDYVRDENQPELDLENGDSRPPPTLPRARAGVRFRVSDSDQISIDRAGSSSEGVSQSDLPMYEALLSSVNDFLDSSRGTNAFQHIRSVACKYREVLVNETLSIDLLYAYGIRLENARSNMEEKIHRDELPDLETKLKEPLDSVLSIHGVSVLSTRRGRHLISLSRQYNQQDSDDNSYKEAAQEFVHAVQQAKNLFEAEVREEIDPFNSEIGLGRFPKRSRHIGRTFNLNLMLAIGSISIAALDLSLAHSGAFSSAILSASAISANLAKSTLSFMIQYEDVLKLLAAAAREELSWLPRLLNWIRRKYKKFENG